MGRWDASSLVKYRLKASPSASGDGGRSCARYNGPHILRHSELGPLFRYPGIPVLVVLPSAAARFLPRVSGGQPTGPAGPAPYTGDSPRYGAPLAANSFVGISSFVAEQSLRSGEWGCCRITHLNAFGGEELSRMDNCCDNKAFPLCAQNHRCRNASLMTPLTPKVVTSPRKEAQRD